MEGGIAIKVFIKKTTAILFVMTIIMMSTYVVYEIAFFKTLVIAFSTTLYHFSMRLLVGFIYQQKFDNNISWENKWFQVSKKEMSIYQTINVKSWKKYIPTYDSSFFDVQRKSFQQIAMAMCQAELVHETIIVFSFLPIIAFVWFGAIEVFIITSIVSAFIDLIFVIVQRYNRPRILKILQTRTDK